VRDSVSLHCASHSFPTRRSYDLALPTAALHTLEHLLAVNLRDYIEGVIDLSPMGCRTGFYLIVWGEHSTEEIRDALKTVLEKHRSEEHTSELQSRFDIVCSLILE